MIRRLLTMALILVVLGAVTATRTWSEEQKSPQCQGCQTAIQTNGWCDHCGVGYIDGQKVTCQACYKARTSKEGGWCDKCGVGYRDGQKISCRACSEGTPHQHPSEQAPSDHQN